ncbi:DUF6441 family protein [Pseudoroseomonas cervicalis]
MLAEEVRAGERAASRAVRAETDALKTELRGQVTGSLGGKARGIANAWRAQVFPRAGVSMRAAGLVWSKTPLVIDAFERGCADPAQGRRAVPGDRHRLQRRARLARPGR